MQQPAVLLLTLGGIAATALIPMLHLHDFGEPGQLARDGGLAYLLTIGLIMASAAASFALHAEIVGGTSAAAISKPVNRDVFLLGKFAGVGLLLVRFWFCMLAAILLAARVPTALHRSGWRAADVCAQYLPLAVIPVALMAAGFLHHRRRARFGVAAFNALMVLLGVSLCLLLCLGPDGGWAPGWSRLDWRILPASLLVLGTLLIFTALATAMSTRLKPGITLIVCLSVLGIGLASDTLQAPSVPLPLRAAAHLAPNLQNLWLADALTHGGRIPGGYFWSAMAYAAAWCVAALGAGMWSFRKHDLG